MPGGRPRKPSAIKALEGNRGRREIPAEPPLHGTPDLACAEHTAESHFKFLAAEFGGAGVLKRADSPALRKLADLWEKYWLASQEGDVDAMCKLAGAWDRAAGKLGLQVVDRSKLLASDKPQPDEDEERFFKVTG